MPPLTKNQFNVGYADFLKNFFVALLLTQKFATQKNMENKKLKNSPKIKMFAKLYPQPIGIIFANLATINFLDEFLPKEKKHGRRP